MKTIAIVSLALIGSGVGISSYIQEHRTSVDRSVMAPGRLVVLSIPAGNITVEGWGEPEVRITGTVAEDASRLTVSTQAGYTEVAIDLSVPQDSRQTELYVRLPEDVDLDARVQSAGVAIDGIQGMVRIQSISGNITIDGTPARLVARSERGDIDVGVEDTRGTAISETGAVTFRGRAGDYIATREEFPCRRDADGFVCADWAAVLSERGEELGRMVSSFVERALRTAQVDGHVDYDRQTGRLGFELAGDFAIDTAQLQEIMADVEFMLGDLEHQVGHGLSDLGAMLENLGTDLRRQSARRR